MKDSLHLTTDDKLVIVDISQDLLKLLDKSEKSTVGQPLDAWLSKDCMRLFLKDVLLAYRGETIENHVATIVLEGKKWPFAISIEPTMRRGEPLATKLRFDFKLRQKAADCNPLFKASAHRA